MGEPHRVIDRRDGGVIGPSGRRTTAAGGSAASSALCDPALDEVEGADDVVADADAASPHHRVPQRHGPLVSLQQHGGLHRLP